MARLFELTSLIVWDEAVMANKNTMTSLDITLRDVLGVDKFMGGIVFVCAGDFRQILPVVRGGGKSEELNCCLKSSYFWEEFSKLELTENVRLSKTDIQDKKFAEDLSGFRKRRNIRMWCSCEREELVERVCDDFEENFLNVSYFEKQAIISPTNDDVDNINEMVFKKLKENEVVYRSEDTSVETKWIFKRQFTMPSIVHLFPFMNLN
ncbi:uncharacterized protein LOC143022698 [Oratosquilla oratoria]|uniref:uncharacterized protein LOC143022698 n=1 Tax=Oratosquilla oratoria TaxID=337810 RepID=UPI003F7684EA